MTDEMREAPTGVYTREELESPMRRHPLLVRLYEFLRVLSTAGVSVLSRPKPTR